VLNNDDYANGYAAGMTKAAQIARRQAHAMREGLGEHDDFEWSSREIRDAVLYVVECIEDEIPE